MNWIIYSLPIVIIFIGLIAGVSIASTPLIDFEEDEEE